ncbi:MAG: aminotransferase class V-fold PLP-dependent enzyme [Planctomycetes bacterium]|nr:aminotransferase class V-fold PLP-dependent enzyme [Planctomycetota bacterium]
MANEPVYMDNHATTRVDPRVVEAMLPAFDSVYGNSGSTTHPFGWAAKDLVDRARQSVAACIGAGPKEIIFTSGATESCNLALRGAALRNRKRGNHLLAVATEHPAVLDPLRRLEREGFELTLLPVIQAPSPRAGLIDLDRFEQAIRDDTVLASVMLANSEIGALAPLEEIGRICRSRGVLLHTDATQAVGKMAVDVERLGVDLMSFSAHKLYGPKGIGALYIRRRTPRIRLVSMIDGGGQERGLRSGTLNTPGIVGMARAMELCGEELPAEAERIGTLRDRLFQGIAAEVSDVVLNGPSLLPAEDRLRGNLNVSFPRVEGESLILSMKNLAVSSGSACASANPQPSHVLVALGVAEEVARGSVRFGLGRFNTSEEVDFAIATVGETVRRLRKMSSLG